jgi:hypothetical protein
MPLLKYSILILFIICTGCSNSESIFLPGTEPVLSDIKSIDTVKIVDTVTSYQLVTAYDTVVRYVTDTVYMQPSDIHDAVNPSRAYTDTVNIVFFGNSLLLGYSTFGMSASDPSQDYYSKVVGMLRSSGIYTNSVKVPALNFESLIDTVDQEDLLEERLYPKITKETDIVILQLGDNVNTDESLGALGNKMDRLVTGIMERGSSRTRVYNVATWYTTEYTNRARAIIKERSRALGVGFVDISPCNTEENRSYIGQVVFKPTLNTYRIVYDGLTEIACTLTVTFTVSGVTATVSITPDSWSVDEDEHVLTWTGHEYVVTNQGIASHPGDDGFTCVAESIFDSIMSDK